MPAHERKSICPNKKSDYDPIDSLFSMNVRLSFFTINYILSQSVSSVIKLLSK